MQLVNQHSQNHRAGGTQRVAHGDGSTVHIDLVVRHLHLLHKTHHDGCKGFVHLKQVNLVNRQPRLGQRLAGRWHRTSQHDGGVSTAERGGHDAGARCQVMRFRRRLVANQHSRRAIDDARRIARMVYVVDALHLGVTCQRHLVKTHAAHLFERGLQSGQAFQRGAGLDEFVTAQNDLAQAVLHRHHGSVKVTGGLCLGGAALRFQCKCIHIGAAKAFQRGNQVGTNALGHEGGLRVGLRVHGPGSTVGANRHTAHALHAASHDQVFPARAHLLRRHIDGLQARGAKAVDLHARGFKVPTGLERRHLGYH